MLLARFLPFCLIWAIICFAGPWQITQAMVKATETATARERKRRYPNHIIDRHGGNNPPDARHEDGRPRCCLHQQYYNQRFVASSNLKRCTVALMRCYSKPHASCWRARLRLCFQSYECTSAPPLAIPHLSENSYSKNEQAHRRGDLDLALLAFFLLVLLPFHPELQGK